MKVRVKDTRSGQLKTLDIQADATLDALLHMLHVEFQLDKPSMKLKRAAPPFTKIQGQPQVSLSELGIKHGDSLMVESPAKPEPVEEVPAYGTGGSFVKRPIPDDNSCLFNSVGYVVLRDLRSSESLRLMIAETVRANPKLYDSVFLGMPPLEYCARITQRVWGGAIEMSIFSNHFKMEIVAVDVETGKAFRFGEDKNYEQRVFILYSGIHYDAIAWTPNRPGTDKYDWTHDKTVFSTDDDASMAAALSLAAEERSKGQFTNTAKFKLKCAQCGAGLKGEAEAQSHAASTGHVQFTEYS